MPIKELSSKQEKQTPHDYILRILPTLQEQVFLQKSSGDKIHFKSSTHMIMLYGPFNFIFILIKPLTVKKQNTACFFHNFLH